ncbi:hypothetical protein [Enterococcus avium]
MGLLSIYPLVRYTRKEKKQLWLSIVGIIATLYATNQEQMALLILAFTVILGIFNWYKKRSIKPLLPTFIIGTLNLIYVLTARGNEIRYNQELTNWFPDFEKLSIPKKIELGYSSTLRHLFFDKQSTILLFLFLLFVFTLSSQIYRKKFSFIGIFGLLPLPISLLFSFNDTFDVNSCGDHLSIRLSSYFLCSIVIYMCCYCFSSNHGLFAYDLGVCNTNLSIYFRIVQSNFFVSVHKLSDFQIQ